MSLPTEKTVGAALQFLGESDSEYGILKGAMKHAEYMLTHHKALAMVLSDEPSAAAKKIEAEASDEYRDAVEAYRDAVQLYETLQARRQRAVLTIEVWRSLNSARKQGANI